MSNSVCIASRFKLTRILKGGTKKNTCNSPVFFCDSVTQIIGLKDKEFRTAIKLDYFYVLRFIGG